MIQLQVVLAILESIVELCIVSFKVPPSEFESNAPSSWISRETKTTGRLWSTCDRAGRWARLIRTGQRDGVPHFFFFSFFFGRVAITWRRWSMSCVRFLSSVFRVPITATDVTLRLPADGCPLSRLSTHGRRFQHFPIGFGRIWPTLSAFEWLSLILPPLPFCFMDFTGFTQLDRIQSVFKELTSNLLNCLSLSRFPWFYQIGSNSTGFQRVDIEFVQLLKFE